jgi:hypothetical protein
MKNDLQNRLLSVTAENTVRASHRSSSKFVAAAITIALPIVAHAQLDATASVTGQYESNSNVYDLQFGYPVPGTMEYRRSDSDYAYGAIVQLKYLWSLQEFYATASGDELHYDHFTELNHGDYKFNGGWNWKIGTVLDGNFDVLRSSIMVPFTDITQEQLAFLTEQKESAKIGLKVAADWRLEGTGYTRVVDESLVTAPNLQLQENSGTLAVKYLGNAGVTAGLTGGFVNGDYSGAGATGNPSYRQTTAGLLANYEASGHSTFLGEAGYTRRTSATGIDNVSGPTGELDYTNQVTAKTSIKLGLNRILNSYLFTTGSEIDTNASVTVNWQATYKIGVLASYVWTYRELPGQGNAPVGSERLDHMQYTSLKLDYEVLRWLAIKPYVNILTRNSNFISGAFNSTIYGIFVTLEWQK